MNKGFLWGIVALLFLVIVALAWILFAVPAPAHAPTTEVGATSTAPLHERVVVEQPKKGAVVGKTFTVSGEAPGNWYFEASFPIQVRDANQAVLATVPAQAKSDWMTIEQVPFSVSISLDTSYSGEATLVLLRDNPSGLPENDDSLEVPIVIQ